MKMSWRVIQPSQLYLNRQKLTKIEHQYPKPEAIDVFTFKPVPIMKRNGKIFYTDGHHRAFQAYQLGFSEIPVEWEIDTLDWELYDICVEWCEARRIFTIADLAPYILDTPEYEQLWIDRCQNYAHHINQE